MPTAGEQSGDRQRREKGLPILTAEKGEHERAPRAGESYPTPLRATLRAPPSKWAIKGFFPAGERSEPRSRTARRAPADRSPRRAAGRAASGVAVPLAFFCTLFFRHRKKSVSAPWDGKSHSRAVVGASFPIREKVCACGRTKGPSACTLFPFVFRIHRSANVSPKSTHSPDAPSDSKRKSAQ